MKVDFSCKGEDLTFGDNFNKWYSYGRWQFLWEQVCCDKKKNKRNNTYKYINIYIYKIFVPTFGSAHEKTAICHNCTKNDTKTHSKTPACFWACLFGTLICSRPTFFVTLHHDN